MTHLKISHQKTLMLLTLFKTVNARHFYILLHSRLLQFNFLLINSLAAIVWILRDYVRVSPDLLGKTSQVSFQTLSYSVISERT